MFEKYLSNLKSKNNTIIEETIDEISTIQHEEPHGEIRDLIIKYCKHEDPYIRRVALRASAMHWSFPEAFYILEGILLGDEKHEEVLDVACSSIGCYKGNLIITEQQINDLYVKVFERSNLSEKYKRIIYYDFLKHHNLIDTKKYASITLKNAPIEINMKIVYENAKK